MAKKLDIKQLIQHHRLEELEIIFDRLNKESYPVYSSELDKSINVVEMPDIQRIFRKRDKELGQ